MEDPIFGQNLWNKRDLEAPPVTTYLVCTRIDTSRFRERFQEAVNFFNAQKQLQIESAFLSTSVFRMKQKFRSDKGFKCMQKLHRALRNLSEQNILGIIENFHGLLPKTAKPGNYLPTKNMLDFILVKLQGLAMLLRRIIETAKIGAHLMEERIAIGQLWRLSFIMYSMMSRIAFISEKIVEFSCEFYKSILPMRQVIGNVNSEWLSGSYEFPDDLKRWLNLDLSQDNESTKELRPVFEITEDSDVEFLENEKSKVVPEKSAFEKLLEGDDEYILSDDQAQETSFIEELPQKKNKRKRRKKLKKESNDDVSLESMINCIQTASALKKFVSKESEFREKDRNNSIFGHLDSLQWNMLQNSLKKFLKKVVKYSSDQNKVDVCLGKAREVLKANLQG